MTYTVFSSDEDYLKPISTDVDKNILIRYGEIEREIYDNYDSENAKVVGYVLSNGFYALQKGLK
jgi:hypothetical protein